MSQELDPRSRRSLETKTQPKFWEYKHAARAVFLSFRFSQGDDELQTNFFKYVHTSHPELKIFHHAQNTALKFLFPNNQYTSTEQQQIPNNHTFFEIDKVPKFISGALEDMASIVNSSEQLEKETLIPQIIDGLIERDLRFFKKSRSRSNPDPSHLKTDPYSSFIIEYSIRGTHTGLEEFNEMFGDIKTYIEKHRKQRTHEWVTLYPKLMDLSIYYSEHHPNNRFYF